MTQKTVLITGCSSGIGYDAAYALKARGWQVFATCRQLKDVVFLQCEGFQSCVLDYADEESIDAALSYVLSKTNGKLSAVFNNGAYACPGAVEDLPTEALRAIFETNVFGYHSLTRKLIPIMRKQGHGRIINCSSVLGLVSMPWRGSYVASKFALEGLTATLRIEMRDTPIHVILIEPGPITSKIRENSITHFEKWVDWKASPRKEQYEKLLKRRYHSNGTAAFELPPSAVSAKLVHALEAPCPKACYYVTMPTYFMSTLRRLLPISWLDALLGKKL